MERHLSPFAPELLIVTLVKRIEPIENFEQLGFSRKSAQDNFLAGDEPGKFAVIVHESHVEEHRVD